MKRILILIIAITYSLTTSSQNVNNGENINYIDPTYKDLYSYSYDSLINGNNKFSFDLLRCINMLDTSTNGKNLFISPFSIYNALAMVYDGANNETAKEMSKVLNFNENKTNSHWGFIKLLKEYEIRNNKLFKINNAAVGDKNFNFYESYLKSLKDFGSKLLLADFSKTTEIDKTVKDINSWVSNNTNNKINNILSSNNISEKTKLIIMNTIYFNANWNIDFDIHDTKQKTFIGKNSIKYVTDFMNNKQDVRYAKSDDAQLLVLEYEYTKASLYIIMPNKNIDIDNYISTLDLEKFKNLERSLGYPSAYVSIPKFKMKSEYELKNIMENLGLKTTFSSDADFSGMSEAKDLSINELIHKSFISITEKGTEATAASVIPVINCCANTNPRYIDITINRPFVFIIRENFSNAILFIGKYVNPEN